MNISESKPYEKQLLDFAADPIVKGYFEAVLAWMHDSQWTWADDTILYRIEIHLADFDRRQFGTLLRDYERRERHMPPWDHFEVIRNAILKIMGVSLNDYLVAAGKKKYRSIDDE